MLALGDQTIVVLAMAEANDYYPESIAMVGAGLGSRGSIQRYGRTGRRQGR